MRIKQLKRLEMILSRQTYALEREELDYFQELLQEAEDCLIEIQALIRSTQEPLSPEERTLILSMQQQDTQNRRKFKEQQETVKLRLKTVRISAQKSMQYTGGYDLGQVAGVFFDRKGC